MNSMADNQKVYQAIKTIADELCKENKTYLRADLAFELKKYGIASDSSDAENGGYPPTQNGDIRSLFWLFSLMALQN